MARAADPAECAVAGFAVVKAVIDVDEGIGIEASEIREREAVNARLRAFFAGSQS